MVNKSNLFDNGKNSVVVNQVKHELKKLMQQALALHQLSKLDEAEVVYKNILKIDPNNFDAMHLLGVIALQGRKFSKAVNFFLISLKLQPNNPACYSNMGIALKELGRLDDAIASYDQAILLQPNYPEAYSNRGNILKNLLRLDDAIASYDKAIRMRPEYAEAHYNRANVLKELGRLDDAIASYDQAILLQPNYPEAYSNRGNALYEMVRLDEARLSYQKALECDPNCIKARWAIPFSYLSPILFHSRDIDISRQKFSIELEKLDEWFTESRISIGYQAVGTNLPFYLAYQERNNQALLSRYGKLTSRIMANWQIKNDITPIVGDSSGKIKVGIVGEQIRNHSVWNAITKGLVLNLDPSEFELHIFHLGSISDHETVLAKSKSSTFTKDQSSLHGWANEIIKKQVEVLIYPEIGMHTLTTQLANLRLAPLQLVAWGHPETSGIPSIDFYLSGDLFETEVSQNFYSEKLIKLPNLGCCYSRMPIITQGFNFARYGINVNEPILICAGTLFKYSPEHDWVWIEIAKKLGKCKLIFFEMQEPWPSILKGRLEMLFIKANLDIEDFILFIPRLTPNQFYGLLRESDVFLDSIGFSGFNTAIQAVDCELPVVTRATEFMRGRLASGILKRMGMSDLIASTNDEYIELAVRLVQDKSYKNEIRQRLALSRDILYDDLEPIRALEDILKEKTRGHIFSKYM